MIPIETILLLLRLDQSFTYKTGGFSCISYCNSVSYWSRGSFTEIGDRVSKTESRKAIFTSCTNYWGGYTTFPEGGQNSTYMIEFWDIGEFALNFA